MTQEKQYAAVHMALICDDPAVVEYKDFIKSKPLTDEEDKDAQKDANSSDKKATSEGVSLNFKNKNASSVSTTTVKTKAGDSGLKANEDVQAASQMMLQESKEFQKYMERRNHHAMWMSSKYPEQTIDGLARFEVLEKTYAKDSSSEEDEVVLWMHHNFCTSKQKNQAFVTDNMGVWASCKEDHYESNDQGQKGRYFINDGFELPQGRVAYLDKLLNSLGETLETGAGALNSAKDRVGQYNQLLAEAQDQMKKKVVPRNEALQGKSQNVKNANRDNGSDLLGNDVNIGAGGFGINSNTIKSPDDLASLNQNSLKSGGELDPASLNGQKAAAKKKTDGILKSLLEKLKKIKEQNAQRNAKKSRAQNGSSKSKAARSGGQISTGSLNSGDLGLKEPEILNDGQKLVKDDGKDGKDAASDASKQGKDRNWQNFLNKYGQNGSSSSSSNSSYGQKQNADAQDASGLSAEEREEIAEGLSKQKGLEVSDGDSLWSIITKTYQRKAYPTLLKLKPAKARR